MVYINLLQRVRLILQIRPTARDKDSVTTSGLDRGHSLWERCTNTTAETMAQFDPAKARIATVTSHTRVLILYFAHAHPSPRWTALHRGFLPLEPNSWSQYHTLSGWYPGVYHCITSLGCLWPRCLLLASAEATQPAVTPLEKLRAGEKSLARPGSLLCMVVHRERATSTRTWRK